MLNLPKYTSHKVVMAAKIVEIAVNPGDFGYVLRLSLGEGNYTTITVSDDWINKRVGGSEGRTEQAAQSAVGGYFMQYADGYQSWSPAKAFEEGYKPEGSVLIQPAITGYRKLDEATGVLMNSVKELAPLIAAQIDNVLAHLEQQFAAVKLVDPDPADVFEPPQRTPEQAAEFERLIAATPHRWVSIARTHFQQGLMALTRAVAQPEDPLQERR